MGTLVNSLQAFGVLGLASLVGACSPERADIVGGWRTPTVAMSASNALLAQWDADGVTLVHEGSVEGRLEVSRFGCDGELAKVAPGRASGSHHRQSSEHRAGRTTLTETWEAREQGLEQTFDVAASPCDDAVELVIELAARGFSLSRPSLASAIELRGEGGRARFRYGDVHAFDAARTALPARLVTTEDHFAIRVALRGARFPIVVDPTVIALEQKVVDPWSDGGKSTISLGESVALSGNTAIAAGDTGFSAGVTGNYSPVDVYVRVNGAWAQQAKLDFAGNEMVDGFAKTVALYGDHALVARPWSQHDTPTATPDHGDAAVFARSGTEWRLEQKFVPPDTGDDFGASVAIYGDTAVIGAPTTPVAGNQAQGQVYVFTRSGTTWALQATLVADDGAVNDRFGFSVALNVDTLLVGAAYGGPGAVYVYERTGATWTKQVKLDSPMGADGGDPPARFGWSVALSGETAFIGSPIAKPPGYFGVAYVYERSGTTWTQTSVLAPIDGQYFGWSVSVAGDWAAVGAYVQTGVYGNGITHLYHRTGSSWDDQASLPYVQTNDTNEFGSSVAVGGCTLLVGAPMEPGSGALYFYRLPGEPCPTGRDAGVATDGAAAHADASRPVREAGISDAYTPRDTGAADSSARANDGGSTSRGAKRPKLDAGGPTPADAAAHDGSKAAIAGSPPDTGGCSISERSSNTAHLAVLGALTCMIIRRRSGQSGNRRFFKQLFTKQTAALDAIGHTVQSLINLGTGCTTQDVLPDADGFASGAPPAGPPVVATATTTTKPSPSEGAHRDIEAT